MLKKIGVGLLITLVVLLVCRDFIIKEVIVGVGSKLMGAPVSIGGFSLSLLTSQVKMKDVRLYNPQGFSNNALIDIDHVEVHFDLPAILSGKQYFSLIDLDIKKLAIERNKAGKFNVASLEIKFPKSDKPLIMKIDTLKLNVQNVTMLDNTKAGATEKNYDTGLHNKTFKNITSPQQLVGLVLFESSGLGMVRNMAANLTKNVMSNVESMTDQVSGQLKNKVGSLLESVQSKLK